VAAGGGKLLYTGDHQQLGAIEAGGMLNLLVADNGCVELSEIHRFTHPWEADASIRLRAGDAEVLETYEVQGRLVGGTEQDVTEAAMRGWLADTLTGKRSLLVTASNAQAQHLSAQLRTELVRLGHVDPQVLAIGRDGNPIGVGDWVQARRNDPTIPVEGSGMVTNRITYEVLGQDRRSRTLRVRSAAGVIAHLPPEYVAAHTTLAYAATVHAAQGRTVDTCHAVIDIVTDRASAYVALTRGRDSNTAYVICQRHPDAHQPERLETTRARMGDILTRPEQPGSVAAELTRRAGVVEGRELGWIGSQFDDITGEAAHHHHTALLAGLLGPESITTLVGEPGYKRLLRGVRAAELVGHDPAALLDDVVTGRSLIGAESMSDVLRWRIHYRTDQRSPERTVVVGDWSSLCAPLDGPVGTYMEALARAASVRQAELGHTVLLVQPEWAMRRLGAPPGAAVDRDDWVRRAGAVAAYRELRGIPASSLAIGPAPAREQVLHRALWCHAHAALGPTTGDELDYATASDAQLREMREHYRRETTWAPYHVHDELRDARLVATGYHHDAILWRAEAQQLCPGSRERDIAEADVAAAEALAARYDARVEHLQIIATARERWHHESEQARTRHILAGQELTRRGLPVEALAEAVEQTALFDIPDPADPGDRRRLGSRGQRHEAVDTVDAVEAALAMARGEIHQPGRLDAGFDPHQPALFPTHPRAVDVAAAQPLRAPTRPNSANDTDDPLSLAQARRQAEIITELRAEQNRWIAALEPTHTYLTTSEDIATESDGAHRRRYHADLHDQQLQRALGRGQAEDLDSGMGF
jgi:hypothetical protein